MLQRAHNCYTSLLLYSTFHIMHSIFTMRYWLNYSTRDIIQVMSDIPLSNSDKFVNLIIATDFKQLISHKASFEDKTDFAVLPENKFPLIVDAGRLVKTNHQRRDTIHFLTSD